MEDPHKSAKGCLFGWVERILRDKPATPVREEILPYRGKDYLLTKGERAYYDVLSKVVPSGYILFVKVRLADIVYIPKGTQRYLHFLNRVSSKHVDFVICDTRMVGPKLVIELDDRSHQRRDRASRDDFVNKVLGKANIPILHVRAAQTSPQQQVASAVSEYLL